VNENSYSYLFDKRLAQGAAPPANVRLPFDTIVLAAIEYQNPKLPDYELIRAPLSDNGPPPTDFERKLIRIAAHEVAEQVRSGRKVLVTCWQGRNRSGVIAGLALRELGFSGPRAALLIQRIRNGLTNSYFREMVVRS
jgi:protein-tyrosine phosphatase